MGTVSVVASEDKDLDWLYRRDAPAEPAAEHTRVMSERELSELAGRTRGDAEPRTSQRTSGGDAPLPSGARTPRPTGQQQRPAAAAPPKRPGPPPTAPSRPKRRRHPVRAVIAVLGVLVAASLVWLIAVPIHAWSKSNEIDATPAGKRPAASPGTLFLLVGSDSRAGLSKEQQKKLGTGDVGGARTDTMMLLYLPPSGEPALISLPRDSFVSIPDNGKNKLNAAYAFGGPKLLEQTVEANTGLRIDGYLEVGFGGFVNVVDAVGGVDVCVKKDIKDKDAHLNVKKGCQTFDGVTALGYVRMRKADPRGDLGRVERQRQVIAAIAEKAATPASVINPVRYWKLNNAAASSLQHDGAVNALAMARIGMAAGKIATGGGIQTTVPIADPNYYSSAGSSVLWDDKQAGEMFEAIRSGDTEALKKFTD